MDTIVPSFLIGLSSDLQVTMIITIKSLLPNSGHIRPLTLKLPVSLDTKVTLLVLWSGGSSFNLSICQILSTVLKSF